MPPSDARALLWPDERDEIRDDLAVVVGCAAHREDRPIAILEFALCRSSQTRNSAKVKIRGSTVIEYLLRVYRHVIRAERTWKRKVERPHV